MENIETPHGFTAGNFAAFCEVHSQVHSGDEFTTLSCVISVLMDLDIHLEEMKMIANLSEVSSLLQSELDYLKYTAPGVQGRNPVMYSTYRLALNPIAE